MDENEIKERTKLGAFVAGGLVLFLIAVFFIGNASNFFNKTFVVSAISLFAIARIVKPYSKRLRLPRGGVD